jgi:hypothetical protein
MTVQTEITKPDGSLLAGQTHRQVEYLGQLLTFPWGLGGTPCES